MKPIRRIIRMWDEWNNEMRHFFGYIRKDLEMLVCMFALTGSAMWK